MELHSDVDTNYYCLKLSCGWAASSEMNFPRIYWLTGKASVHGSVRVFSDFCSSILLSQLATALTYGCNTLDLPKALISHTACRLFHPSPSLITEPLSSLVINVSYFAAETRRSDSVRASCATNYDECCKLLDDVNRKLLHLERILRSTSIALEQTN